MFKIYCNLCTIARRRFAPIMSSVFMVMTVPMLRYVPRFRFSSTWNRIKTIFVQRVFVLCKSSVPSSTLDASVWPVETDSPSVCGHEKRWTLVLSGRAAVVDAWTQWSAHWMAESQVPCGWVEIRPSLDLRLAWVVGKCLWFSDGHVHHPNAVKQVFWTTDC